MELELKQVSWLGPVKVFNPASYHINTWNHVVVPETLYNMAAPVKRDPMAAILNSKRRQDSRSTIVYCMVNDFY